MSRKQTALVDQMVANAVTDRRQLRRLLKQKSEEFLMNPPEPNTIVRYKGRRIAAWHLTLTHNDGYEGSGLMILLDEYGNFRKGWFRRPVNAFSIKQMKRMISTLDERLKQSMSSIPHRS